MSNNMNNTSIMRSKNSPKDGKRASRASELSQKIINAQKALPEIEALQKLPIPDREIFARNLGEMYLAAQAKDSRLSFQTVFESAFGEEIATSLVKKRKSVILFANDNDETVPLQASPYKYLHTARSLATHMGFQVEGVDQEILAISQLIDASSFDKEIDIKEEVEEQTLSLVRSAIKKMVSTATNSVDFRQLFVLSKDHQYYTAGNTGKLHGLYGPGGSMHLDITEENDINNNCMPCVTIGTMLFPANKYSDFWGFYFEIDTPEDDSIDEFLSLKNGLHAYFESLGLDGEPGWMHDSFEAVTEKASGTDQIHSFHIPQIHQRVDLELRYSVAENKVLPAIIHRVETTDLNQIIDLDRKISTMYYTHSYFDADPATVILDFDEYEDGSLLAVKVGSSDEKSKYLIFHTENMFDDFNYANELKESITWVDSNEFRDMILESDDHFRSAEYGCDDIQGYVPAPQNSIAHSILKNIAYFPKEFKLDQLLLKDSIEKRDTILKILSEKENEFRKSFDRWMNENG